jgi:hypothetical protein
MSEAAYWPTAFRNEIPSSVRIFYDKTCLAPGQQYDWSDRGGGFIGALCKSIVFIPLVSLSIDGAGQLIGSFGRLFEIGYKVLKLGEKENSTRPISISDFKTNDTIWFSSSKLPKRIRKHVSLFTLYSVKHVDADGHSFTAAASSSSSHQIRIQCKDSNTTCFIFFDASNTDDVVEVNYSDMKGTCMYHSVNNHDDVQNNVLFEWMFACSLNIAYSKMESPPPLSACRSIYPIFYGGVHSKPPIDSIVQLQTLLSAEIPGKIRQKIKSALNHQKLKIESLSPHFFKLRHFVSELLRFQGYSFPVKRDTYDTSLCCNVFSCISMAMFDLKECTRQKPMAHELVEFLEQTRAKYMIYTLTNHNVCSVSDLCFINADLQSELADEISESCRKSHFEVSLHLLQVVHRAQSSEFSQKLDKRLKNFNDENISIFTAVTSRSSLDLLLGKTFFVILTLVFAVAGAYSAVSSYYYFQWEGNTVSNLCLAIGCAATAVISYFKHPRWGKYIFAVMLILMVGSTFYGWYSSRDSGFGYCEDALAHNRLITDHETCDNYLFFVILFIQIIEYSVAMVFALLFQQFFFVWILVMNTVLNVCWFVADMVIVEAKTHHKVQDMIYASVCFLFTVIVLACRRNLRQKARMMGKTDAKEHGTILNIGNFEEEKQQLASVMTEFSSKFQGVVDSTQKPLQPLHQDISNLQELYSRGQFINETFQEWIESWFKESQKQFANPNAANSAAFHKIHENELYKKDGIKVVKGPIKQPTRAIAKIYRVYGGEVSRLTDIVRCSIVCQKFSDVAEIAHKILKYGEARPQNNSRFSQLSRELAYFFSNQHDTDAHDSEPHLPPAQRYAPFCILRIRNRFASDWKSPDGYKDLSFKLLIAFEESDFGGCWFIPVADWKSKFENRALQTLICELQLKWQPDIHADNSPYERHHKNYVERRDILSQ